MSDNAKLRFDLSQGRATLPADRPPVDATQLDDAEAQMRRALGLHGDAPRPRQDAERSDPVMPRSADRFMPTQRRKFVQDGDIPVTIVRRSETGGEFGAKAQTMGGAAAAGGSNQTLAKLQRAEEALAAETAARQQAERTLAEVQASVRDLRTKMGHADLARNELQEQLRRDREAHAGLRAAVEEHRVARQEAEDRARAAERQLSALQNEVVEERIGRKNAERALRAAEEARESAERLARVLSEEAGTPRTVTEKAPARRAAAPARAAKAAQGNGEPEPVKWWLTQPAGKRR